MDKSVILKDFAFLRDIYNQFAPDHPLPAHDPVYVQCHEVRGKDNILREVGRRILFSDQPTCQVYTGHRGGGKSTEILRLKDDLEKNGCRVVYFEADEDIDLQEVSYVDILLACTRHIVEDLGDEANEQPLYRWAKEKLNEFLDVGLSEIEVEKVGLEQSLPLFSKITATLKAIPDKRRQIRKQVESNQVSFTQILNQFIEEAEKNLKNKEQSKLVVIADNLDRIPIVRNADGSNNHDQIFIDHSEQLKRLNCHLVYTVPISLVYSSRASTLKDLYGDTQVLPMIMVRDRNNNYQQNGIEKIQEIIKTRVDIVVRKFSQYPQVAAVLPITLNDIFESTQTLNLLCQMTGGHVREVMFLMQEALNWIDDFPITQEAVENAIAISRNTYNNTIDHGDWVKLVEVFKNKKIVNESSYRELLFSRCVLEYRDPETLKVWHDIHPLIEDIDEFKDALSR